jgi:hypothetical protein
MASDAVAGYFGHLGKTGAQRWEAANNEIEPQPEAGADPVRGGARIDESIPWNRDRRVDPVEQGIE